MYTLLNYTGRNFQYTLKKLHVNTFFYYFYSSIIQPISAYNLNNFFILCSSIF